MDVDDDGTRPPVSRDGASDVEEQAVLGLIRLRARSAGSRRRTRVASTTPRQGAGATGRHETARRRVRAIANAAEDLQVAVDGIREFGRRSCGPPGRGGRRARDGAAASAASATPAPNNRAPLPVDGSGRCLAWSAPSSDQCRPDRDSPARRRRAGRIRVRRYRTHATRCARAAAAQRVVHRAANSRPGRWRRRAACMSKVGECREPTLRCGE